LGSAIKTGKNELHVASSVKSVSSDKLDFLQSDREKVKATQNQPPFLPMAQGDF